MFVQFAEPDALEATAGTVPNRTIVSPIPPKLIHDAQPSFGKGLVTAVAISIPFWALVAFTFYLLT